LTKTESKLPELLNAVAVVVVLKNMRLIVFWGLEVSKD